MRQSVVGLLAHVDAGKTTLAEALLFCGGAIRKAGRVDHGDAHLDFESVERERGITVFSKQAVVERDGVRLMLLDAPGHVDFGAEAERTLQVLDLAVLVVGANDGVQGHTETLWRLLSRYEVPTVLFVNKTDLVASDRSVLFEELSRRLGAGIVDMTSPEDPATQEALALQDETALDELLEAGALGEGTVRSLVMGRKAFPCLFGSALRMTGVDGLLDLLAALAPERAWPAAFGARVYKVSHGARGERIAWLRVTGGTLRAKEVLDGVTRAGERWVDKVDQLRVYQGSRFDVVREVPAGQVCAATGLAHVLPGDGLGFEAAGPSPVLAPVLDYAVLPQGCDAHAVHLALRRMAEEDPLLGVAYDEHAQEVRVQLMGSVQLEVVRDRLLEQDGLRVGFGPGSILYKETIADAVAGVGHFEPLRHYAEVHLLLEPLERGAGVEFGTCCLEDDLDRNWQRLILTNAMEREHLGVLVGAPLTDVRVTLVAGRAHPKHTEGGDFRQATYRAIRQGLMQAQGVLLEPWYRYELGVPASKVGRALADLQRMEAQFDPPVVEGEWATLEGVAPVATMRDYALQVSAYTGGRGHLFLEPAGYDRCHDADEVVAAAAYDPEADLPNTPDSVFCSHGAGYTVKWKEVGEHAHVHPDPARRRPWRAADASFFSA